MPTSLAAPGYVQGNLAILPGALASVSQVINSALNLDDALNVITREACVLMQAKMASLKLLDESRQWLELRASSGAGQAYLRNRRLNVEDSLLGIVVRRKKPLQVPNVQTSSRYQSAEVAAEEGLVGLLSVPLLFAGQAIGTLPERLATYLVRELPLAIFKTPLQLPRIEIAQVWHERVNRDAGHRWLRERIFQIFRHRQRNSQR